MGTTRPSTSSPQTVSRSVTPMRSNSLAISNGSVHSSRVKSTHLFSNLSHGPLAAINAIIVHQTDSFTAASTLAGYARDAAETNKGNRGGVGAHFLIDKDGTIYQTADISKRCWHIAPIRSRCYEMHTCSPAETGRYSAMSRLRPYKKMFVTPMDRTESKKQYPARYPDNADSIGIEIAGKHLGDEKSNTYEKPTEAQQASLHWLVTQLLDAYGLTTTDVYRHPQVSYKNEGEAKDAAW